jgi:uncharacterized protein
MSKRKIKKLLFLIIGLALVGAIYWVLSFSAEKQDFFVTSLEFQKEGELLFLDSLKILKSKIDIEIADDDIQRAQGLMYRYGMDDNQGMLFIFPKEEIQSFWMKDTYISLDIVFVNSANRIVSIHSNTKVQSEQSYKSSAPAKYVIEVNGDFCSRNNILLNDIINFLPPRK